MDDVQKKDVQKNGRAKKGCAKKRCSDKKCAGRRSAEKEGCAEKRCAKKDVQKIYYSDKKTQNVLKSFLVYIRRQRLPTSFLHITSIE